MKSQIYYISHTILFSKYKILVYFAFYLIFIYLTKNNCVCCMANDAETQLLAEAKSALNQQQYSWTDNCLALSYFLSSIGLMIIFQNLHPCDTLSILELGNLTILEPVQPFTSVDAATSPFANILPINIDQKLLLDEFQILYKNDQYIIIDLQGNEIVTDKFIYLEVEQALREFDSYRATIRSFEKSFVRQEMAERDNMLLWALENNRITKEELKTFIKTFK